MYLPMPSSAAIPLNWLRWLNNNKPENPTKTCVCGIFCCNFAPEFKTTFVWRQDFRWCWRRRSDSGTGHTRLATERWVRQWGREWSRKSIANEREDITQFNIRNFYAHSTRRRTIPSHNISSSCSINKALSEAKTLLKRERKSKKRIKTKSCVKMWCSE